MEDQLQWDIDEFRSNFNDIYLAGIRRLLDEDGMLLSYLLILTALETLGGLNAPRLLSGQRFELFLKTYFPTSLNVHSATLWKSRNLVVHAFNPGGIALVFDQPHVHLSSLFIDVTTLDVNILFNELVSASDTFFADLASREDLQLNFSKRLQDADGGGVETRQVFEF